MPLHHRLGFTLGTQISCLRQWELSDKKAVPEPVVCLLYGMLILHFTDAATTATNVPSRRRYVY